MHGVSAEHNCEPLYEKIQNGAWKIAWMDTQPCVPLRKEKSELRCDSWHEETHPGACFCEEADEALMWHWAEMDAAVCTFLSASRLEPERGICRE